MSRHRWAAILTLALLATTASSRPPAPRGYYAAPDGRPLASGTKDDPWDLGTALAGAAGRVRPGDTVWLRGGVYRGTDLRTDLRGTAAQRITFRQRPGERATIDGRLLARGAYLDFWGFEITQSDPLAHPEIQLLDARTDHGRFINLVLHDANTHGVNFWTPGVDAELYGCIVYNNGTHENLDHGAYVHNESGVKRLMDNVFFANYARGIQVYASAANDALRNVQVEGNVSFNNGTISRGSTRVNLLISARVRTEGMTAVGNMLFFSDGQGSNIRLGHYAPAYNGDVQVRDNYAAGGAVGLEMPVRWDQAVVEDNTLVGAEDLVSLDPAPRRDAVRWRGNRYGGMASARAWRVGSRRHDFETFRRLTGLGRDDRVLGDAAPAPAVFVRPNKYEPGRAHIVVYNWGQRRAVAVDVHGVLRPGDRYELRNVQALFGLPVTSGVYRGDSILVPMTGVDPPVPVGRPVPRAAPRTGPVFDVFLLTRVAESS